MSSFDLYFICGSNESLREGKQRNWEEENRDGEVRIVRSIHRVSNDVTSNSRAHRSSLATFHKTMFHFQVLYRGADLDHINPYFVLDTLLWDFVRRLNVSLNAIVEFQTPQATAEICWLENGCLLWGCDCTASIMSDLIWSFANCAIGEKGRQKVVNRFLYS